MDLDDLSSLQRLDSQNYYDQILGIPDHFLRGWQIGQHARLKRVPDEIQNIVICGMGGSAIGADLACSYAKNQSRVPLLVNREYDLPACAQDKATVVLLSSHSGNTEETLSCFHQAVSRNCSILAVSTGGELEKLAVAAGVDFWKFDHQGQPRAAVGYSLGFMLAAFHLLGVIQNPEQEIVKGISLLNEESKKFTADIPIHKNPAKRYAGQLVGRIPVFFGSDYLTPVARRFKTQVNELAKGWAQFEFLPEADHNTAAGILQPEFLPRDIFALFLESDSDHPRNRLRSQLTRQNFLVEGIACDFYRVPGDTPLANILAGVQFCDFVSYYLAVACDVDPTPIPGIEVLKKSLPGTH